MRESIDRFLQDGIRAHESGDVGRASAAYARILEIEPEHADALHLSGLIAFQTGDGGRAVDLITRAIAADARVPLYHANLGRILKARGDDAGAAAAYRSALALTPEDAHLHADLAAALLGLGAAEEAKRHAGKAVDLGPGLAEAHLNLGLALQDVEGPASTAAEAALQRAAALRPDLAGAHLGLGLARQAGGDGAGAAAAYRAALERDPRLVAAHCNLGNLCRDDLAFAEALAHYRAALALDPDNAAVWGNLGVALQETGDHDGALDAYDRAVGLAPEDPDIRRNRAMARLAAGRFREGWADYDYRWRTARFRALARDWPVPEWDGDIRAGLRLWVHAEQGLGDTLQFCRYLPLLAERGMTVWLECADSLAPLMRTLGGIAGTRAPGAPLPDVDAHVPLLSLPQRFGTTAATIPADVPYVAPPKAAVEKWAAIVVAWPPGQRIGIAWRGAPDHVRDKLRSPGLAPLMALAAPGRVLVSLQVADGGAELGATAGADEIVDPTVNIRDFADTAALMTHLDAVVSCDSAPLHLAGALGIRAFALLPHVAEWRWGRDGGRTPWYPTMTLIRQPAPGDWAGAVALLGHEL